MELNFNIHRTPPLAVPGIATSGHPTSATVGRGICRNSERCLGWGGGHKSVELIVRPSSMFFNQCSVLLGKCARQLQMVYVYQIPG